MRLCDKGCRWGPMTDMHQLVLDLTSEIVSSIQQNLDRLSDEQRKEWNDTYLDFRLISDDPESDYHIIIHPDDTIELSYRANRVLSKVVHRFHDLMQVKENRVFDGFAKVKELFFLFMLEEHYTSEFARYFS
jgi:hypothetical protein